MRKKGKSRKNPRAKKNPALMLGAVSLAATALAGISAWWLKDQTQDAVKEFLPPVTGAASGYLIGSQLKFDQNTKLAATVLGGALGFYIQNMIDEKKREALCGSTWWFLSPTCWTASQSRSGLHQLSDTQRKLLDDAAKIAVAEQEKP